MDRSPSVVEHTDVRERPKCEARCAAKPDRTNCIVRMAIIFGYKLLKLFIIRNIIVRLRAICVLDRTAFTFTTNSGGRIAT